MFVNSEMNFIGVEIKGVDHLMQREMLKSAAQMGIDKVTVMHGWIIGYLMSHDEEDVYQRDIESYFSIARSTVTNIVQCMEKKGYVKRVSIDSDARFKKLLLTDTGRKVGEDIRAAVVANEERCADILSGDERGQLLTLLRKLRLGLENLTSEGETI
ncbi:MAG: MarR family transcriptional regulator [Ruminococcus sp.]|nr:MarR family transcriptional regulator [Ruminococcus sp.]